MTCNATSPGSRSTEPLCLALNAAEDRLQLVLGTTRGTLLHAQEFAAPYRSMPLLAPALQHAFLRLGLKLDDLKQRLTGIACVHGPGNFTGLRLSLATALGLSKSLGVPLAGVEYLPLLAAGPLTLLPESAAASVWAVTHARQGEVFVQGFAYSSQKELLPAPLAPAVASPLDAVPEMVVKGPQPALLLGSGVRRHERVLSSGRLEAVRLLPPFWDHPQPLLLLRHALAGAYAQKPVSPLYLRVSDAEENLPALARKQGRDPESMRSELERLRSEMP